MTSVTILYLNRKLKVITSAIEIDEKELAEKSRASNQINQSLNQKLIELQNSKKAAQQMQSTAGL